MSKLLYILLLLLIKTAAVFDIHHKRNTNAENVTFLWIRENEILSSVYLKWINLLYLVKKKIVIIKLFLMLS